MLAAVFTTPPCPWLPAQPPAPIPARAATLRTRTRQTCCRSLASAARTSSRSRGAGPGTFRSRLSRLLINAVGPRRQSHRSCKLCPGAFPRRGHQIKRNAVQAARLALSAACPRLRYGRPPSTRSLHEARTTAFPSLAIDIAHHRRIPRNRLGSYHESTAPNEPTTPFLVALTPGLCEFAPVSSSWVSTTANLASDQAVPQFHDVAIGNGALHNVALPDDGDGAESVARE